VIHTGDLGDTLLHKTGRRALVLATEDDTKLLLALLVGSPAVFGRGTYFKMFWEMGPIREAGIALPGKIVRFPLEFTVSGSYT
jgi:hypothetical protein